MWPGWCSTSSAEVWKLMLGTRSNGMRSSEAGWRFQQVSTAFCFESSWLWIQIFWHWPRIFGTEGIWICIILSASTAEKLQSRILIGEVPQFKTGTESTRKPWDHCGHTWAFTCRHGSWFPVLRQMVGRVSGNVASQPTKPTTSCRYKGILAKDR